MDLSRATSVSAEIDPPLVIQVITVSEQSNEKSAVPTFLEETSFCQSFLPKLIMRELNKEDAMDRCKWRKVIKEAR